MNQAKIYQGDPVILSEESEVLVASPNCLPEVSFSFADLLIYFSILPLVEMQLIRLIMDLIPGKSIASLACKTCIIIDHRPDQCALVRPGGGPMISGHGLNKI
jgi:hypothetical protein